MQCRDQRVRINHFLSTTAPHSNRYFPFETTRAACCTRPPVAWMRAVAANAAGLATLRTFAVADFVVGVLVADVLGVLVAAGFVVAVAVLAVRG